MYSPHSGASLNQRATEFHLHGPLTLVHDGVRTEVPLGGQRELLAMLLLERHRGRSRIDLRAAYGALEGLAAQRRFGSSREALNRLLAGTGLKVIKTRSAIILDGDDYRSDLDDLITGLRSVETASSLAEVFDIVDQAVDLGPGAPLEGLNGSYFLPLHNGFKKVWRAAAIGWVCAANAAGLTAPSIRFRALFSGKARGLESNLPILDMIVHDSLKAYPQAEQLAGVKAVIRNVAIDIERHVVDGTAEAIRGVRRAANRKRAPLTPAPVDRQVNLEVSVYLGDGEAHGAVEAALTRLLSETGMETFGHEPPIAGSWYRRLWARTRIGTAHLSAEQIAAEVERKLRIEVFDKAQAAIDNQQATGAAALIAALQGETHACIRVGSLLVLKVDGQVLVNTLTQYQLAWLERNQVLLRNPAGLLRELERLSAEPADTIGDELPTSDMVDIEMDSTKP